MFDRTSDLYDLVYDRIKDYERESRRIHELIEAHPRRVRSLLDVACGTGRHIELLRDRYACVGLDIDPELLAVARARNPDTPFVEADMTDFSLGRRFDVVTCLFSSIGYVVTRSRLDRAIGCLAKHLSPGGLLLLEPWLSPGAFEDGHLGAVFVDEPGVKVARMNTTRRHGRVSELHLHYLVGRDGDVSHLEEVHRLGLFDDGEYRDALLKAGLSVSFDPDGLIGRGLYIATPT